MGARIRVTFLEDILNSKNVIQNCMLVLILNCVHAITFIVRGFGYLVSTHRYHITMSMANAKPVSDWICNR